MNPRPRIFFYVQHLLGIGHLVRASRLAKALDETFHVAVAIGGDMPSGLDFGAAEILRLPPVKAGPGGFADLVGPNGALFGEPERAARRDLLLARFDKFEPEVLLIEAFPFGRRQMRFELLPLLAAARARDPAPLVAASVRDILQEHRKPTRDRETVDHVERFFDLVLVHGDAGLATLDLTFPLAREIADKTVYTGLVGPAAGEMSFTERFEVIVSVGGGAVGARLLEHALAARPLCRLSDAPWLVLTGPNLPEAERPRAPDGVSVRTFDPDLAARLKQARVSVSQAGYNTVADVLSAPACRAVLVPHAAGAETEQARRAGLLAGRGLAVVVPEATLDARSLARAIDRSLDLPPPGTTFRFDGAAHTGEILQRALLGRGKSLAPVPHAIKSVA